MTVDVSIAGMTFDGFAPAFAARAGVAFEAALLAAADVQGAPRDLGLLVLDGLDFSTPERLGQSLAQAILREVAG